MNIPIINATSFLTITECTKACFIERAATIKPFHKLYITWWLNSYQLAAKNKEKTYTDYIKTELVLAAYKKQQVWEAIQESDHIWCSTYFQNENSTSIFIEILVRSVENSLSNKFLFNIAYRAEAIRELTNRDKHAVQLMQELEAKQNINFYFWDDIEQMNEIWATMP